MADDIIFRIGADTSDLDAAMAQAKFKMAAPGAPGSPLVTPLPPGLGGGAGGGQVPPGFPRYGGSGPVPPWANPQAIQQATLATNQLASAQNNAAQSSQQLGINFAAMIERMLVRLVIFRAIFEAINAVKQAMTEASQNERLRVQFENLSTSAKTAGTDFDNLSKKARAIGVTPAEWIKVDEALMKAGESAHDAAIDTETLGEYAKESGESAETLASAFEKVKLGTGAISDMRTLVSVMGEAGNALRDQISQLEQEEILQKRVNEQIAYATMLREHAYEQQQRQNQATEEFGDKLGLASEVFQDIQEARPVGHVERAGVDVTEEAEFMEERERAGEKELEQERHKSQYQIRRLEAARYINEKDLLAAAKRGEENEHTLQQQKQQEDQARKRLGLEERTVALNKEVLIAVQARQGLEGRIAAEESTQAAAAERNAQAFAQIADDSQTIHGAMVAWNTAMGNVAHNFQVISGLIDNIYAVAVKLGWAEAAPKAPVMSGGINVNPQPYVPQGPITAQEWLFGHPSAERWKAIENWDASPAGQAARERSHQINEQILEALNRGLLGQ